MLNTTKNRIGEYPNVKVEFLDEFYALAEGTRLFDKQILKYLVEETGWRGIVPAGLFSSLAPDQEYLELLRVPEISNYPETRWSCECAISLISGQEFPTTIRDFKKPLKTIAKAIHNIAIPKPPIRRAWSEKELSEFEDFCEEIRVCYHRDGVDAAKEMIHAGHYHEWLIDYPTWATRYGELETSVARCRV